MKHLFKYWRYEFQYMLYCVINPLVRPCGMYLTWWDNFEVDALRLEELERENEYLRNQLTQKNANHAGSVHVLIIGGEEVQA